MQTTDNMANATPAQSIFLNDLKHKTFELFKKYWNSPGTDDYWDSLMADSMKLIEEFRSEDTRTNEFIANVMAAFLNTRE